VDQGSKAIGEKKEDYLCNTEIDLFIKTREGRRLLTSGVYITRIKDRESVLRSTESDAYITERTNALQFTENDAYHRNRTMTKTSALLQQTRDDN